jgi:hypothetical protein
METTVFDPETKSFDQKSTGSNRETIVFSVESIVCGAVVVYLDTPRRFSDPLRI